MDLRVARLMYLMVGVFVAGASIAAILVYFFAPRSGRETRKNIASSTKNMLTNQQKMLRRLRAGDSQIRAKTKQKKESWLKKLVA